MEIKKTNQRTNPWNAILSKRAFETWDKNGRVTKGVDDELYIHNRKLFKNYGNEACITFNFHDGFAVGDYQGREYLLLYPTVDIVEKNKRLANQISTFSGGKIQPYMVAMAMGKIEPGKLLPLNLNEQDVVIRLDAPVAMEEAEKLITMQTGKKVEWPDDFENTIEGIMPEGYLVLREKGNADFFQKPQNTKEEAEKMKEIDGHHNFFMLKHLMQKQAAEGQKDYYTFEDFQNKLKQAYPDGLTVHVQTNEYEIVRDVYTVSNEVEEMNPITDSFEYILCGKSWEGKMKEMEKEELDITITITPDKYMYIWPGWEDYRLNNFSLNTAANEVLQQVQGNINNVTVKVPKCVNFISTMKIEGAPLRKVIDVCNKYELDDIAGALAANEYLEKGAEASVQETPLNKKVVQEMSEFIFYKNAQGITGERLNDYVKWKATNVMRGLNNYKERDCYNLKLTCKSEKDSAFLTENLNKKFPEQVSALYENDKLMVSFHTTVFKEQKMVEDFILSNNFIKDLKVKPFDSLKELNRMTYVLSNGQIMDAYINRPAHGLEHFYIEKKMENEKRSFLMQVFNEETAKNEKIIAFTGRINELDRGVSSVEVVDSFPYKKNNQRVSEVNIIYNRQKNDYHIRCKIDGVYEMGRVLPEKYKKILENLLDSDELKHDKENLQRLKTYFAENVYKDLLQRGEAQKAFLKI